MMRLILSIGVVLAMCGVARAQDAGTSGGACYGNGTCNAGLACEAGVCVAPQAGAMGGACYGNSTCNAGMTCEAATQTCVADAAGATVTAVGATSTPAATSATATGGIDSVAPSSPPPPAATAAATAAAAPAEKRWWLGAKAGFLLPGTVTIDGTDFDSDSGLLANITLDGVVAPRLCLGGFLLYGSSGLEGEVDATVITVGGTIKGRFPAGNMEIRPGIVLGYQTITGEAFEDSDDSTGIDVGGTVELAVPISPKSDFLGEIGFVSQPGGGNEDSEITFGPIFYIAGGASFGG